MSRTAQLPEIYTLSPRSREIDTNCNYRCVVWWSAMMVATAIVTRLPVGICRNSLGPCALECGPSTPVTTNASSGILAQHRHERNRAAFAHLGGRRAERRCRRRVNRLSSSHGDGAGDSSPSPDSWPRKLAPCSIGRRVFEQRFNVCAAFVAIEHRREDAGSVSRSCTGSNTLPALRGGGRPSIRSPRAAAARCD